MDIRHAVGVTKGVPPEKLADVLTYRESPHYSERERAALQFCERFARDDLEVSEECLAQVREYFSCGKASVFEGRPACSVSESDART